MPPFRHVIAPVRISAPGGKIIGELFGRASTGTDLFSLAHMVAPGGWTEPPQVPELAEVTLVVHGRLVVEAAGEQVELRPGQALLAEPGTRVRYGNPFPEPCEYYAFCMPAFTPERACREE